MKIYTKQGDAGQTGLFGGPRVSKSHVRIEAYGTLDELNSLLGLGLTDPGFPSALRARVSRLQSELFQLGAELATPPGKNPGIELVGATQIEALEREIEAMEEKLEPLKTFILPGGSPAAGVLHLARTVSRRAERAAVALHQIEPLREGVLQYLNRLSDYLFVCARFANREAGVQDVPRQAPKLR